MARPKLDGLSGKVSTLIKNKGGFNLDEFKKSKFLDQGSKFKKQE